MKVTAGVPLYRCQRKEECIILSVKMAELYRSYMHGYEP